MDNGVKVDTIRFDGGNAKDSVAYRLLANNMDSNSLRPMIMPDGKSYIVVNAGVGTDGKPKYTYKQVNNGLLRQDQWRAIDKEIVSVSKPELVVVGDLRANGLVKTVDGMSTPIVSYERRSDITGAIVSMNPLRRGENDRQEMDTVNTPLPVIHKDVQFDIRNLNAAARGGLELDTAWISDATQRVAQAAEEMLLGTTAAYYFGGSNGGGYVYGYRTFPTRLTKTLTLPTASTWTPQTLIDELLDMRQALRNKFRRGPYAVYLSTNWDTYLDSDYSSAYNGNTLRSRIAQIEGLKIIRSVDYLGIGSYQILMVELQKRTVQEIVGMDIRAMQWDDPSGLELNIKIMAILTPQIRTDFDGNVGINHGTAA